MAAGCQRYGLVVCSGGFSTAKVAKDGRRHGGKSLVRKFHPGIDDGQKYVADQVAYDHKETEEDYDAHDHGVVPVRNAAHEIVAQAGDGEAAFHDERSRQKAGHQRPQVGNDGGEGVFQGVLGHDHQLADALGPGRA